MPLAQQETGTQSWFAWQIGPSTFGIYDTFETEEARQAHLNGPIAAALMEHAPELLSAEPTLEMLDVLAEK